VGIPLQPPSAAHLLGTNGQGQDVLVQLVAGTRVSLAIGFAVGFAVVLLGAAVGVTAGYFGGRVDGLLSVFSNVFLVLPGMPLAIVIAAYLPSGPATIAFVLIVTGWAWNARVMRAQTMALRRRDFVAAAIVAGESDLRVLLVEILPNMMSVLVAQVIGSTVYAIGAQVGLEFLGLGDVSRVTWGTMLYWAQNDSALLTGSWWTSFPPPCVALSRPDAAPPGLRRSRTRAPDGGRRAHSAAWGRTAQVDAGGRPTEPRSPSATCASTT
jgi:peptide/nickel transport system permease protein